MEQVLEMPEDFYKANLYHTLIHEISRFSCHQKSINNKKLMLVILKIKIKKLENELTRFLASSFFF